MPKKSFINPHVTRPVRNSFKNFFLWKIGYFDGEERQSQSTTPVAFPLPASPSLSKQAKVTWINHSTFLICIDGIHILTDPIWSNRCSPVPFLGPKRRHAPGIAFSELPQIDIVLLSHDHYDHLDKPTVFQLSRRFPKLSWFVPKGVKRWFDRHGIGPVYELAWWDERMLSLPGHPEFQGKITAVPAQHFSGRRGYDLNSTLWAGWVFEAFRNAQVKRCYFVGDTGYNSVDFKKIGERFAPIDLSLIPIGAYEPRAFMESVHVSPIEAVKIHREVGSKFSIGMHWKTFCLTDEPMDLPPIELYQELVREKIDPAEFIVTEPGHAICW